MSNRCGHKGCNRIARMGEPSFRRCWYHFFDVAYYAALDEPWTSKDERKRLRRFMKEAK